MKFLVITDVHGRGKVAAWVNRKAREMDADGIIVLGDITHFGPADWAGEFLDMLRHPVYAVPGNCDPHSVVSEIEAHATSLHERKMTIGGRTFIGLGGSNPTIFDTPFEMDEDDIMAALRPLMEPDAVLVLHCPPKGINDRVATGQNVGSTAIRTLVEEFRPAVVLAGHIHEARGIVKDRGTLFMNPGPAKDGYSGLLELDGEPQVQLLEREAER